MISVNKAIELLSNEKLIFQTEEILLKNALGKICATAIFAEYDTPLFDNSAVDGYAIQWENCNELLTVSHEIPAGIYSPIVIENMHCARIFTGAHLPEGTDSVVMQEHVEKVGNCIKIHNTELKKNANVRFAGSQNKKGDTLIKQYTLITAGVIGYLSSVGINTISVFKQPKIDIVITGSEIVPAESKPLPGQVFESNGVTLQNAFLALGFASQFFQCTDDLETLTSVLSKKINECDILIITGGVSVGDYDFVIPALEKNKVQTIFHKVKQKPAKPFYFGKKNKTFIFGLPGNPASTLTCFYAYIQPWILSQINHNDKISTSIIQNDIQKKQGLTHFYKALEKDGKVYILTGQESYKMDAFVHANCFVMVAENIEEINKNSVVDIIRF